MARPGLLAAARDRELGEPEAEADNITGDVDAVDSILPAGDEKDEEV